MDPDVIGELGRAFDAFKVRYDAKATDLAKQLEEVEKKIGRPQFGNSSGEFFTPEQKAHAVAFTNWLRNPRSSSAKASLEDMETKVASSLTDSAGGVMVPELLLAQIAKRVKDGSAMRSIANVVSVGTSDVKMILSGNDASSGWVGETDTRSATSEPTVIARAPTFGIVYSYVQTTEELAQDSQFNVGNWFIDSVTDEIVKAEGQAFIDGNGTNKPTGLLNTSPESGGDDDSPERNVAAFRYLPTGAAAGFANDRLGSPAGNPADVLYDAIYDLKADYRRNAVWLMNSATAGVVRKWKDGDGRYLWTDPIALGQPAILGGYRVVVDEAMPDVGTNAHPVMFGDFRRGYLIADMGGLRITLDENITTPGRIKYYIRRRVGGCVVNNDAVRVIKCATS